MKFKHLLLTASVMALFSSCSNDELVSENTSHGDAIAFSVTTTNATRAADYWCNSNLPNNFAVSAAYCDGTNTAFYFKDDVFKKDGEAGNYVTNDGNYRYWPELPATTPESISKYVNIYAYKTKVDAAATGDGFAKFEWNSATDAPTISMTPAKTAAEQHDLLYAYTQVTAKPAYGDKTAINFRHALSQIVFYAQCQNSKIYVEIEDIALVNAAKKGVFTLPTGTNVTDDNLKDHTQASDAKDTGLGTWALKYDNGSNGDSDENSKNYYAYTADCKVSNALVALTPGASADAWTNLTDNKNTGTAESGTHSERERSLLVLPQTDYTKGGTVTGLKDNSVKAYKPKDGALETAGGACIAIKCKIRNISGKTSPVDVNDIYLWGSAEAAKYLVVPVDFNWEQGKKYIYRINFSKKGHGGYDPGTGDEVLVPIQLSVSVDDFAEVTDTNLSQDI